MSSSRRLRHRSTVALLRVVPALLLQIPVVVLLVVIFALPSSNSRMSWADVTMSAEVSTGRGNGLPAFVTLNLQQTRVPTAPNTTDAAVTMMFDVTTYQRTRYRLYWNTICLEQSLTALVGLSAVTSAMGSTSRNADGWATFPPQRYLYTAADISDIFYFDAAMSDGEKPAGQLPRAANRSWPYPNQQLDNSLLFSQNVLSSMLLLQQGSSSSPTVTTTTVCHPWPSSSIVSGMVLNFGSTASSHFTQLVGDAEGFPVYLGSTHYCDSMPSWSASQRDQILLVVLASFSCVCVSVSVALKCLSTFSARSGAQSMNYKKGKCFTQVLTRVMTLTDLLSVGSICGIVVVSLTGIIARWFCEGSETEPRASIASLSSNVSAPLSSWISSTTAAVRKHSDAFALFAGAVSNASVVARAQWISESLLRDALGYLNTTSLLSTSPFGDVVISNITFHPSLVSSPAAGPLPLQTPKILCETSQSPFGSNALYLAEASLHSGCVVMGAAVWVLFVCAGSIVVKIFLLSAPSNGEADKDETSANRHSHAPDDTRTDEQTAVEQDVKPRRLPPTTTTIRFHDASLTHLSPTHSVIDEGGLMDSDEPLPLVSAHSHQAASTVHVAADRPATDDMFSSVASDAIPDRTMVDESIASQHRRRNSTESGDVLGTTDTIWRNRRGSHSGQSGASSPDGRSAANGARRRTRRPPHLDLDGETVTAASVRSGPRSALQEVSTLPSNGSFMSLETRHATTSHIEKLKLAATQSAVRAVVSAVPPVAITSSPSKPSPSSKAVVARVKRRRAGPPVITLTAAGLDRVEQSTPKNYALRVGQAAPHSFTPPVYRYLHPHQQPSDGLPLSDPPTVANTLSPSSTTLMSGVLDEIALSGDDDEEVDDKEPPEFRDQFVHWQKDPVTGLFWSSLLRVFFHPLERRFFDPRSGEWTYDLADILRHPPESPR